MIKILHGQTDFYMECPATKRKVLCYQSVNKNLKPPCYFGKILCSESDNCKNKSCKYHNCYIGDEIL